MNPSEDDDAPPDPAAVSEAEAEREETVMPWIWGGIGLLVIAAFTAWLVFWPALSRAPQPAAAAPITHTPS